MIWCYWTSNWIVGTSFFDFVPRALALSQPNEITVNFVTYPSYFTARKEQHCHENLMKFCALHKDLPCCVFPCWNCSVLQWPYGQYIHIPCYCWITYQIKRLIFPVAILQENLTKNFRTMEFSKLTKVEVPHGEDSGGSAVSKKTHVYIFKSVSVQKLFKSQLLFKLRRQHQTVSIKNSTTLTYVNIKKN